MILLLYINYKIVVQIEVTVDICVIGNNGNPMTMGKIEAVIGHRSGNTLTKEPIESK